MESRFTAMLLLDDDLTDAQVEEARSIAIEAWRDQLAEAGGAPIGEPLAELVRNFLPSAPDVETGVDVTLPGRAWHVVGRASRPDES